MSYKSLLCFFQLQHDIVISAFSLMEMPDMKNRLELVSKLWKKTIDYLIIVEQGSNAGFQVCRLRNLLFIIVEILHYNLSI